MSEQHVVEETEEQQEAKIRAARTRRALLAAPELAEHLRQTLTPADGRTERGEIREWRTPLLTGIADAADELLLTLDGWARFWAHEFKLQAPVTTMWRDAEGGDRGFRAGTTPRQARAATSRVSVWLSLNTAGVATHPDGIEYQDEITWEVWSMRQAAGLVGHVQARISQASSRQCPICHEHEVHAEFFGEPMGAAVARGEQLLESIDGIAVRCAHCGWEAPARATQIARWLS